MIITLEPEKICKNYLHIQKADKICYNFYYNHGCAHSLDRALTDVIGVRELMTNPVLLVQVEHELKHTKGEISLWNAILKFLAATIINV